MKSLISIEPISHSVKSAIRPPWGVVAIVVGTAVVVVGATIVVVVGTAVVVVEATVVVVVGTAVVVEAATG
tara:strand:- start:216 stop:428 length:213 start_codon:yes stop_codon:yes gene_type:complete